MIQRVADMEQLQLMMNVINIYCDSTEKVHDLLFEVKFGMQQLCKHSAGCIKNNNNIEDQTVAKVVSGNIDGECNNVIIDH